MDTIDPISLNKLLLTQSVILIDVREPIEHYFESIEGSVLIPLADLSIDKLDSLDKTIVTYCRSGKRSLEARYKLLSEDPSLEVYSLDGGIIGWQEAGFEVKKPAT